MNYFCTSTKIARNPKFRKNILQIAKNILSRVACVRQQKSGVRLSRQLPHLGRADASGSNSLKIRMTLSHEQYLVLSLFHILRYPRREEGPSIISRKGCSERTLSLLRNSYCLSLLFKVLSLIESHDIPPEREQ